MEVREFQETLVILQVGFLGERVEHIAYLSIQISGDGVLGSDQFIEQRKVWSDEDSVPNMELDFLLKNLQLQEGEGVYEDFNDFPEGAYFLEDSETQHLLQQQDSEHALDFREDSQFFVLFKMHEEQLLFEERRVFKEVVVREVPLEVLHLIQTVFLGNPPEESLEDENDFANEFRAIHLIVASLQQHQRYSTVEDQIHGRVSLIVNEGNELFGLLVVELAIEGLLELDRGSDDV